MPKEEEKEWGTVEMRGQVRPRGTHLVRGAGQEVTSEEEMVLDEGLITKEEKEWLDKSKAEFLSPMNL